MANGLKEQATVYAMMIPDNSGILLSESRQKEIGGSDQRAAIDYYYKSMNGNVVQVPIFDALYEHREEKIFFATDHHWTALGAYYSYQQFAKAKGIKAHELSEYEKMSFPNFIGSYYSSTQANELKNNPETVDAYIPLSTNRTAAFENFANQDGLYAKTIIGDAYSASTKEEVMSLIRKDFGQIDLLVYSLAAPRRTMPDGTIYTSVLKTTKEPFTSKSLDLNKNQLTEKIVLPATQEEIDATIHVMGGEDWSDWISALRKEHLLSENIRTVAYSYIGPEMTYPIYTEGTIGQAKQHLYHTALQLTADGIPAYVSVNKAVVTQSSSAIPVVPLYMSILYKVMKEAGIHETTIEQMYRLWNCYLLNPNPITDIPNRIRLDDFEMRPDIQQKVLDCWNRLQ